jgi:hypothetical protein
MKTGHASSARRASSLALALIGLGLSACSNDFTRGDATAGDAPGPVSGVPGRTPPDDAGVIPDAADAGWACTPAATAACTADLGGHEIPGLSNPPKGLCAVGVKTCSSTGNWGPCVGAVGPKARDCESSADNDCDGKPDDTIDGACECNGAHPSRTITGGPKNCACDEACGADHRWTVCTPPASCDCSPAESRACTGASGCDGGTQTCAQDHSWGTCAGAPAKATYCLDHDGDTFCAASTACSVVCPGALGTEWKTSCATTDCDDSNAAVNPSAKPSCKPVNECHTGALSCTATGNTCADTGGSVANRTACTGGMCNAGACAACVAGDARCTSNTPQSCSAAGQWVSGAACASVATCSSTGTTAKCACPAGYTGDGTTCAAAPVLVCTANGTINSSLALAGGEIAFSTQPYPVDGGTAVELDVCAVAANGAQPMTLDANTQSHLGYEFQGIASHASAAKFYVSSFHRVSSIQTNRGFMQYSAPTNSSAAVPLTVVSDLPRGNSSFLGTFAVDAVNGYVFLETTSGLQVTQVPEPVPSQTIAPSSCYSTADALGAVAAGGNRAAVFDVTASTILGLTAPACAAGISVATGVTEVDALATDGINVFFNDGTNTYGCPFTGCGVLAASVIAANQGVVSSIALDDANAYWVGPAGLVSCAKAGCPSGPKVLTATATQPASVAVDGASVYFTKDNAVYRIAKQ